MHAGFAIVKRDANGTFSVNSRYEGHESLAYGIDWRKSGERENGMKDQCLLATCSFYDRCVQLTSFEET